MSNTTMVVGVMAAMGSAIIGGVFFAFSSFVMKALARVPPSQGIRAMQSINVVVINPSFLGAFMGTAVLSVAMIALTLLNRDHWSTIYIIGAASSYLAGTFLVTLFGNVPLNDELASVSATDPGADAVWERYLDRWVKWNHVRTGAAIVATSLYLVGLLQGP